MTKDDTLIMLRASGALLLLVVSGGVGYLWRGQDDLRQTDSQHAAELAVHQAAITRVEAVPSDFDRKLEQVAALVRQVDGKLSAMDTRLARVETKLDSR